MNDEERFNALLQEHLGDIFVRRGLEQIDDAQVRPRYLQGMRTVRWGWRRNLLSHEDFAQRACVIAQEVRQVVMEQPVNAFNSVCLKARFVATGPARYEVSIIICCQGPFQ